MKLFTEECKLFVGFFFFFLDIFRVSIREHLQQSYISPYDAEQLIPSKWWPDLFCWQRFEHNFAWWTWFPVLSDAVNAPRSIRSLDMTHCLLERIKNEDKTNIVWLVLWKARLPPFDCLGSKRSWLGFRSLVQNLNAEACACRWLYQFGLPFQLIWYNSSCDSLEEIIKQVKLLFTDRPVLRFWRATSYDMK